VKKQVSGRICDAHQATSRGRSTTRDAAGLPRAAGNGAALGVACFISYMLITRILGQAYFVSRDDELLGGMWAVIATIFVYRHTYQQSVSAALSRLTATLLSFALCLVYLLIFAFHPWGMAMLIGIGAIVMTPIGRPEDIITTGITTALVMVVPEVSPEHAVENSGPPID
jgi:uncharacterized membrane protein YgaE (UPF0421/DUF939 family)